MPHAPTDLAHLVDLSKKQHAKDTIVLSRICQYLRPGTILEIGAGCGRLYYELQALGYNVIGSDIEPLFVQHMRSRGLKAMMSMRPRLVKLDRAGREHPDPRGKHFSNR